MNKTFIFDTNVFYDLASPCLYSRMMKRKLFENVNGNRLAIASVSLMEIASNFTPEISKRRFKDCRQALRAVFSFCDSVLPHPDCEIRAFFGLAPRKIFMHEKRWDEFCRQITSYPSYAAMRKSMSDFRFFEKHRNNIERKWELFARDMAKIVIKNYAQKKRENKSAKITDRALRAAVVADLADDLVSVDTLAYRAFENPMPVDRGPVIEPFKYYFEFNRLLMQEYLLAGRSIEKHTNDFNDMHFMIYLRSPDVVFVTAEKQLLKFCPSAVTDKRVMPFEEFLALDVMEGA